MTQIQFIAFLDSESPECRIRQSGLARLQPFGIKLIEGGNNAPVAGLNANSCVCRKPLGAADRAIAAGE